MSELPPRPEEPLESDCCGSGCTMCVFDIYQRDLEIWERECSNLLSAGIKNTRDNVPCDVISRTEFKKFELLSVISHTKDTAIYRFNLPPQTQLRLETGQHLILRYG